MKNDKIGEKMLCVLRKHLAEIKFEGNDLRYRDYKNIDIHFKIGYDFIPAVTEPVKFLGIKIYDKVIVEAKSNPKGRLFSWSDSTSYEAYVDIEVYNEMVKQVKVAKEAKFIKNLNQSCHGEKAE